MIENRYRLKDYIITEYDNHFYTWETNIVLGEHRVGKCFIIGDILVFHSFGHEKNGCLKLEYGEKLSRLPVWTKTDYYCFSDSLKDVNTGKSLSNNLDQRRVEKEKYLINNHIPDKKGEYQLGQLKIIAHSDRTLSWEKLDGVNKNSSGSCVIKSGILFLESESYKSSMVRRRRRREWSRKLKSLPKWDITFAWGHLKILRTCGQRTKIRKAKSVIPYLDFMKSRSRSPVYSPNGNKKKTERNLNQLNTISENFTLLFGYLTVIKSWWLLIKPRMIEVLSTSCRFFFSLLKKLFSAIQKVSEYFQSRYRK